LGASCRTAFGVRLSATECRDVVESGMAEAGGLRTVRYWEADGVSGRRLMLRPFSKRIDSEKVDAVSTAVPFFRNIGLGASAPHGRSRSHSRGQLHQDEAADNEPGS